METMFKVRALYAAAVALGVSVLLTARAVAMPVTFGFDGVVTSITGPLDASVQVGTPFAGTYTFESTTLDGSSLSEFGVYDNSSALYGYSAVTLGKYQFMPNPAAPDLRIAISAGPNFDAYEVFGRSMTTNTTGMTCSLAYWVNLIDNSATALFDDKLPLIPPPLSAFDTNDGQITGMLNGSRYSIQVRVTDLYAVPAPGAAEAGVALLGLLIAMHVARRIRKIAR